MKFKAYVDRIEGEFAVIEVKGNHMDWPLSALPKGTSEGSTINITVVKTESNARQEAEDRLQRLKSVGPRQTKFKL